MVEAFHLCENANRNHKGPEGVAQQVTFSGPSKTTNSSDPTPLTDLSSSVFVAYQKLGGKGSFSPLWRQESSTKTVTSICARCGCPLNSCSWCFDLNTKVHE